MKAFYPTANELMAADRGQFDGTILRHLKTYEGGGTVHQPVGGFNRDYYVRVMEGRPIGLGSLPTQPEYGARQPEVSRRVQEAFQRLVTKGYLMHNPDQPVADWFLITSDGEEFLRQLARYEQREKLGIDREAPPLQSFPTSAGASKSTTGAPRAFLSYSWEDPEHQQWVTKFAERLHGESGVEIIFDGWHLKPGDDKLHFMEQAVAKSNFVVVVGTPTYAERANERKGGVGYESMVITAELAEHILANKFIPVLRKGTWASSLPIYLKSRMGVNLSDKPYDEDEYEKLLRVLHGETIQPPPLGKKPDFSKKPSPSSKTASVLGQPETRPNAIAWASYEKPGASAPRESAYARLWNIDGKEQYSFETTRGEEYLGSKDVVIDRFLSFHRLLSKEGYKRMNFTPGPDSDFSVLG